MAELKPFIISIEGVDKVLKSTEKVKKELEEIKRIAKEKNNIELSDTQAMDVLRKLRKEADDSKKALENIDKNVSFARFKSAVSDIKNAVATTVAAAVVGGKTASETVNDIGQSIAGVASNFGPYGVAIGAAISLVTPLVASLFEASDAQKQFAAEMEDTRKASEALGGAIGKEVSNLLTLTSVVNSSTASTKEKNEALKQLNEEYKPYLESLGIAEINTKNLTDATLLLTTAIVQNAIASAARVEIEKTLSSVIASNITSIKAKSRAEEVNAKIQSMLGKRAKELISLGVKEADAYKIAAGEMGEKSQEARDLLQQYQALQGEQLTATFLAKGEAAGAKETAEAYRELSKSLDLGDIIKQFTDLFNITNDIATPKAVKGGGSKKTYTFQNIFGSDFDEIAESAKKVLGDLTFVESDVKKNLTRLRKLAEDEFNQATNRNAEAAQKFIDEDKRLKAALSKASSELIQVEAEVAEKQAKVEEAYRRVLMGEVQGNFSAETQAKIAELAEQYKKGAISLTEASDILSKFRGGINISGSVQVANEVKALRANADKLQKEKDKINDDIRKNDIKAQQQVDTGALQTYNARLKTTNELEKELFEATEKRNKALAKRNIDAADELNKVLLKQGLLDYEAFIQNEKDAADKLLKEFVSSNDTQLVRSSITDFNDKIKKELKITQDLFTFDEKTGLFTITDELIALEVANNPKLKAAYEQNLLATELNNKKVAEIERDLQERLRKRADIFSKEVGAAVNEDYEFEIQALRDKNGELIQEERDYFDKVLAAKEEYNKRRRKAGIKQTDEEKKDLEAFLNDSLVTLKQSYDKQLEIDLFLIDKQIERLKLLTENSTDPAILKQIEDFENKKRKIIENTSDAYEKEAKRRTDAVNTQNDEQTPDPDKIIPKGKAIISALQGFSTALLALINQNSQNIIDGLNEQLNTVEERTADTLNRIASLEDDLEGKRSGRREAVLQALEQQREIEAQLAQEKIALAKRIEEEERKIRKREQAAAIANALINGAIAQTNIWATVPKADFGVSTFVLSGIAAATTAAQVALIASQKFASGGFTGDGSFKDETGHKVAGVVHNDEWVAPKWMVESPKTAPIIAQLEGVRQKGFAEGGFTSPDFNSLSQSVSGGSDRKMEAMIKSYFDASMQLANRPIYTKATEVQTVAQRNNQRRMANTI